MNQRGMSESVQWTLLMPVFITCVLALIQSAIWLNARSVAVEAAFVAAESAAESGGSWDTKVSAATRAADRMLTDAGLKNVKVTVHKSGGLVTVEVQATTNSFISWLATEVTASARRPLEEP
jgi:Flp pilus assembly protein TadG